MCDEANRILKIVNVAKTVEKTFNQKIERGDIEVILKAERNCVPFQIKDKFFFNFVP